jgi:hypothetical protein
MAAQTLSLRVQFSAPGFPGESEKFERESDASLSHALLFMRYALRIVRTNTHVEGQGGGTSTDGASVGASAPPFLCNGLGTGCP